MPSAKRAVREVAGRQEDKQLEMLRGMKKQNAENLSYLQVVLQKGYKGYREQGSQDEKNLDAYMDATGGWRKILSGRDRIANTEMRGKVDEIKAAAFSGFVRISRSLNMPSTSP